MLNRIFGRKKENEESEGRICVRRVNFFQAAQKGGNSGLRIIQRYIRYSGSQDFPINVTMNKGDTALTLAVAQGHVAIVAALLAFKSSREVQIDRLNSFYHVNGDTIINNANNNGETALTLAAFHGHAAVVAVLLTYQNININYVNLNGDTALNLAAGKGYVGIVEQLLGHRSTNINTRNQYGDTALILAARAGHVAIVAALLAKAGINITIANLDGDTALTWAARNGHIEIVRDYLLPRLTLEDITKRNYKLKNAAEEARSNGKQEIALLIKSRVEELHAIAAQKMQSVSPITPQKRLEAIGFAGDVPPDFVCPIGADGTAMSDPITVSSGIIYDRENLKEYFTQKGNPVTIPCPLTKKPISQDELKNASSIVIKNQNDAFVKVQEEKARAKHLSVVNQNHQTTSSSSVVLKEEVPPGEMQLGSNQSSFFASQRQNSSNEGWCCFHVPRSP